MVNMRNRGRSQVSLPGIIIHLVLVSVALAMVYPLYNQLVIALTGSDYIAQADGMTLIPKGITLSTFKAVLSFPRYTGGCSIRFSSPLSASSSISY